MSAAAGRRAAATARRAAASSARVSVTPLTTPATTTTAAAARAAPAVPCGAAAPAAAAAAAAAAAPVASPAAVSSSSSSLRAALSSLTSSSAAAHDPSHNHGVQADAVADVYDYIVVGGGSAGCVLANRLSASGRKRVCLVETGRRDDHPVVPVPAGYLWSIGNPETDYCFKTTEQPGLGGRAIGYARGRLLGGCSSINGMIYMRGQARDYDRWEHTLSSSSPGSAPDDPSDAWGWDQCLPYFLTHEDYAVDDDAERKEEEEEEQQQQQQQQQQQLHARGGELRIEPVRSRWDVLDAFAQAATQAGIPATSDFNRGNNEGVGYFHATQRRGRRWSAADAFLPKEVQDRPNLDIHLHSRAARINFEAATEEDKIKTDTKHQRSPVARATGIDVECSVSGDFLHSLELAPGGEVVLAAGAIATPQLLQVSGVGPASALARAGVREVVLDAPGVGANLQDHLQLRPVFRVQNCATLNTRVRSPWGLAAIGAEYLFRREGPLASAPSQLGAFAHHSLGSKGDEGDTGKADGDPEDAAAPWPDVQFHVQPLSLRAFGGRLDPFDAFTASVANLRPTSRGSVGISSPHAKDAPLINPNYLSTEEDRLVAAASLRLARRIVSQPAMAGLCPEEVVPGPQLTSTEDLVAAAQEHSTTIFHPSCTARMGAASDSQAVVDRHLRVHGVAGLRVADASVMPYITTGNTNAPTYMIAERAAHWINRDAGEQ